MLQARIAGRTAAAIAASIESHVSATGGDSELLPTVRALARGLGVSPATVAAAYKLLRARGLTVGRGRSGTRVSSAAAAPRVALRASLPAGRVDLASGSPDPALLPPLDRAFAALRPDPVLYGHPPDAALVCFAAGEFEADGIPARSLAILGGALDAIERVLREHLRWGDRVAIEDPGFPGVADLVAASGFVPVPCTVDQSGPLPGAVDAALRAGCAAIVVTPRAQNPTGAAITEERASELRRILRRAKGTVLIENDPAAPIAGAPARTLTPSTERWVAIRSTSKFLGPDLRVAVMAGDELTLARVRSRQALGARWVSHILQQIVLSSWADPASARLLSRAATLYEQRREALQTELRARGVAVEGRSGLNLWVAVHDEGYAVNTLADCGWAVTAGERFRMRGAPAIRITTSTLDPGDAPRLAGDVASVVRTAAGSRA